MRQGRLITIEGIDGAGKTTLAAGLQAASRARGVAVDAAARAGRSEGCPSGSARSSRIRSSRSAPRAEALLYAAARAQLVEEAMQPAAGRTAMWVLLDRFVDSSLAYQGGGRALGIEPVRAINEFGTGGLTPDRTLLLVLEPAVARARYHDRTGAPDRLERLPQDFFERVAQAYDHLARAEPARFAKIDASRAPEAVVDAALDAIADVVGLAPGQSP